MAHTPISTDDQRGEALTLASYAERAYLDYAISVVKGRALPDVADGQKPVQRRILYTMREMGLGDVAKPRKSATVVGDVMGKLHPHGDSSIYEALVRMAQPFSLRYPLVDGQGNFGSRDGDGAAAMRYTEARLMPIARLLLDELDEGTVDFQPNYEGTQREPRLLPGRLPMLLLNGASGIAVGMATEIPPHNLREVASAAVALIKDPKADLDDLLALIPGPDFPGGGQLISSAAEIREIYATGRGSFKVRARWSVEDLARGQWQVVINELPPGVSNQRVLEEIEELINPKVRAGKKALSAEQVTLKTQMLALLDKARDESGKDAPVRLVLEPKSRNIDQEAFVKSLLAHTSLETGAPANLVMIGRDGRPRQKGLVDVITEWIAFRFDVVTRRTQHRLRKVDERIHVLEGRRMVLLNIDRVIAVIRESEDPKAALMAEFRLSDVQAEDILELRLRQLARLEGIKIDRELGERNAEREGLTQLLANPTAMRRQIVKEIEADAKQYGDERRTLIREERRTIVEVQRIDEPVTVIVSEKGWVRTVKGHGVAEASGAPTVKAGDRLYGVYECRSVDSLIAFADNGRVYTVPVASLPGGRGEGQPVTSFIDLEPQTRLEQFFAGTADIKLLIAATSGHGLMARVADMTSRQRGGKSFVTLEAEARLLRPAIVAADDSAVACLSERARLLVFGLDEVKLQAAGGRGVTLQDLDAGEQLLAAVAISDSGVTVEGPSGTRQRQLALSGAALAAHFGKRARKGRKIDARMKPETLCRTSRK